MDLLQKAPSKPGNETLRKVLTECRSVAVVGLSPKEHRDSNQVARFLLKHGYRVIPVRPKAQEILGQTCYPDLMSIPGPVDIVDVFRRSDEVLPVAREAVRIGAKVLWMQEGVVNPEAAALAREAGMVVVENSCIKMDHLRVMPRDK